MAVNRVQGTTGSATGATTTVTLTFSAGNLLTCSVQGGATTDTLSASDNNGNTWQSPPDTITDASLGNAIGFPYAMNCNAGSTIVTGNASANNAGHTIRIIVDEWSGCATTSALRDHGGNDQTTASATSGSVTTAGTAALVGDLVMCSLNMGTNSTFSAGTWTGSPTVTVSDVIPAAGSSRNCVAWAAVNSAGAQTTVINGGASTGWILVNLVFAQASAAAAAPLLETRLLRGAGI